MKEYDVYRDSHLRYLGYANEVGEAFRPLVPNLVVKASYAVAISYVIADAYDKSIKAHDNGGSATKVATTAGDVFIWQMLASVMVPGFTINRLTWFTARMLRQAKMSKTVVRTLPTAVGLAAIPLIIHPIDRMIDYFMDNTYRKYV